MTRQPTPQNQRPAESLNADYRAILEHAAAYGEPRDDFGLRLLRKAQALSAEWDRFWQSVIAEDCLEGLDVICTCAMTEASAMNCAVHGTDEARGFSARGIS